MGNDPKFAVKLCFFLSPWNYFFYHETGDTLILSCYRQISSFCEGAGEYYGDFGIFAVTRSTFFMKLIANSNDPPPCHLNMTRERARDWALYVVY